MTNGEESSIPDSLSSMSALKVSETFPSSGSGSSNANLRRPAGSSASSNFGGDEDVNSGKAPSHLQLIFGETVISKCETTEGIIALSNYRLFIQAKDTHFNLSLGSIDVVECRDIFFLHIYCKDARYVRCTFPSNEAATDIMRKIQLTMSTPKTIEDFFAFTYYDRTQEEANDDMRAQLGVELLPPFPTAKERFDAEIKRMEFDIERTWRVSEENANYELCASYPTHIIVPCVMDMKKLDQVACFRSARRIPAVVWRHRGNGAVISRCSQPEVGWFGWRSPDDEELVQNIVHACAANCNSKPEENLKHSSDPTLSQGTNSMELVPDTPNGKKLLILDARSYTTAVANRARGGGCECLEYYTSCEIQFMNLANIHSIRKSFMNVRQLCSLPSDQANWYSQLESCKWLQHMSGLMKAAVTVVTAIENDARPVMVHCSDGWDRTPQIVSLAEILLDPYYRSLEGFQILVEREWLDFGHKFGDRCGQGIGSDDVNERCPVFLQWLDCLHQLIRQFPSAFEFNLSFLVKLAHHTYSNLFGTFLCNTAKEREAYEIHRKTHSVWRFLRSPVNYHKFRNNLFTNCDKVLWPSCEVRDLVLWSQVYLGYENPPPLLTEVVNPSQESSPTPSVTAEGDTSERLSSCSMMKQKTKSCENLHLPVTEGLQRRQSDPSLSDSFSAALSAECVMSSNTEKLLATAAQDVDVEEKSGLSEGFGIFSLKRDEDSENEDTEPNSEGRSESTVINASSSAAELKSIESSTDTIVADVGVLSEVQKPSPSKTEESRNSNPEETNSDEGKTNCSESSCVGGSYISPILMSPNCLQDKDLAIQSEIPEETTHQQSQFEKLVQKAACESHINVDTNGPTGFSNGLAIDGLSSHCEVCETSLKLLSDTGLRVETGTLSSSASSGIGVTASGSGSGSKYSSYNTPMHSRTPSTGIPATPSIEDTVLGTRSNDSSSSNSSGLRSSVEVDGQIALQDEVQSRLNNIVFGFRKQISKLETELQITRTALMKQVCHKCTQHLVDRPDDTVSLPDSICSGEHQSVGHESQSSEISWEAVEESDTRPPLWLPDYAVTRCMGCDGAFWLGRRKHHCRSCGKIFCADCSENSMAIPAEQLYTPVRVCIGCFHRLNNIPLPPGVPTSFTASFRSIMAGGPGISFNGNIMMSNGSSHHGNTPNHHTPHSSTSASVTPTNHNHYAPSVSQVYQPQFAEVLAAASAPVMTMTTGPSVPCSSSSVASSTNTEHYPTTSSTSSSSASYANSSTNTNDSSSGYGSGNGSGNGNGNVSISYLKSKQKQLLGDTTHALNFMNGSNNGHDYQL